MADRTHQRLAFLDVARGLAALLVLVAHYVMQYFPGQGGWMGQTGVILFLLISGFIIPASLEQGGSNARFWLRRVFRLYPLYWASIVVGYVGQRWGLWASPFASRGDWLLNLTMLQGFFSRPPVWGVFWTLQLELVIYASCSLLFAVRLLARPGWLAVAAFAVYAALGLLRPLVFGQPHGVGGSRFLYFAPLLGLIAHHCFAGRMAYRWLVVAVVSLVSLVLALWCFNRVLFPSLAPIDPLYQLARTWGTAFSCFVVLLAAHRRHMPVAACWLGRISYSVYLLHIAVLWALVRTGWPAWVMLPILLVVTLVLSDLAYRFVEVPGIALGRKLERRWLPKAVRAEPAALPVCRAA